MEFNTIYALLILAQLMIILLAEIGHRRHMAVIEKSNRELDAMALQFWQEVTRLRNAPTVWAQQ